jgi:hypothetical protein
VVGELKAWATRFKKIKIRELMSTTAKETINMPKSELNLIRKPELLSGNVRMFPRLGW